ncbi:cellulase family glycosylhydrolase [bacterium]|nr:cellulase family glycosylhydrolase [bacterium]
MCRRMTSASWILLCFCLLNAVSAQPAKRPVEALLRPSNAVFYHVPVGLCEDYPEETTTLEGIRKDFEFLKKSGISLLRISFGWDAIEEKKDRYNWLFWDDFVKMAVDEYRITLIPYVCYVPRWNSTGASDTTYFWNYPPVDYDEFGQFMKDLVTRYRDRIHSWELWNEPDIWVYWQGTAEAFSRLVKAGSRAVREADPGALIVLGGLAYKPEFLLELFRDHGVSPLVDVVNIHNYYETWHRYPVEKLSDHIQEIHEIVSQYGNGQSIWMAEVGYSTYRQGGWVSDSYQPYFDYEHTPDYQAVDLFKRLAIALSTERLAAIAWYELKDLPSGEKVIGDINNRNLGVAFADHSPKPAQKAIMFFNELFSQKVRCIDGSVTVSRAIGSDSEVHCFEKEDGGVIVTAWLRTRVFGQRENDFSGDAADLRKEKIRIELPGKYTGPAVVHQAADDERGRFPIKHKKGVSILENLELAGGKIAILEISK